ncbi:hemagglutinin [Ralstonia syzygii]|uniref:hemagglutinin n=1 Tax=Ralstonia syzygii TaxID=28097 RepID=UPI0018D15ED8|nr:hemagglutinin [Ralstonia syzygii]
MSGTTKVFDSQNLTDQEIRNFAQQLAGDVPLKQVAPNVYNAKLADGTIVNLRSISSSQQQTGARWTVDLIGNPSVGTLMKRNAIEMKFK